MMGETAFCPKTGAPLSDDRYYQENGHALRIAVKDDYVHADELDGELTTGTIRSSTKTLLTHFQRTHQYYHEPNYCLYRKAALRLRELKRAAAGRQETDMVVWLALYARLRETVLETEMDWMLGHVELRCPQCHGRLRYEQLASGRLLAACGTNCGDETGNRLAAIERLAIELYESAFEGKTGATGSSGKSPREYLTLQLSRISHAESGHGKDTGTATTGCWSPSFPKRLPARRDLACDRREPPTHSRLVQ